MSRLYTVTLTDLGTYRLTVAADTPDEAKLIAKHVMWEEATSLPPDLTLVKRETGASEAIAAEPPVRSFRVRATYKLDFAVNVPAASREEAERYARRLYEVNSGPFEFDHEGDHVTAFEAEEAKLPDQGEFAA